MRLPERVIEALQDDTDRWSAHLDWLISHPDEPDCAAQIAEVKSLIAENGRLLTPPVAPREPPYPWATTDLGGSFSFPSHLSEASVRSITSHTNVRMRPKHFRVHKTPDGLIATRDR